MCVLCARQRGLVDVFPQGRVAWVGRRPATYEVWVWAQRTWIGTCSGTERGIDERGIIGSSGAKFQDLGLHGRGSFREDFPFSGSRVLAETNQSSQNICVFVGMCCLSLPVLQQPTMNIQSNTRAGWVLGALCLWRGLWVAGFVWWWCGLVWWWVGLGRRGLVIRCRFNFPSSIQ